MARFPQMCCARDSIYCSVCALVTAATSALARSRPARRGGPNRLGRVQPTLMSSILQGTESQQLYRSCQIMQMSAELCTRILPFHWHLWSTEIRVLRPSATRRLTRRLTDADQKKTMQVRRFERIQIPLGVIFGVPLHRHCTFPTQNPGAAPLSRDPTTNWYGSVVRAARHEAGSRY